MIQEGLRMESDNHSMMHITRYKSQDKILQSILSEKDEIEALSGLDTETSLDVG